MNTLATKLGLLDDDIKQEEKLFRLCADLRSKILTPVDGEFSWRYSEADLSADDALKADFRSWPAFTDKTVWSKKQGHTWFAAEVTVPPRNFFALSLELCARWRYARSKCLTATRRGTAARPP